VTYTNAAKKLFITQYNPLADLHVLTAFSHRILLELGSTATAHHMAADSVNSHLRYATRIDGAIVRTVCPSEPLLSLISIDMLNAGNNFALSLRTLVDAVKRATIDRGQEGELYCRLLIMRARDIACRASLDQHTSILAPDTFSQASFSVRTITLAQHLAALVHLQSLSDALQLYDFTKTYCVNITHMVQFRDPVTAIPQSFLRDLFIRGAAVQCCHIQPVIDGFYVAYGGDMDKPWDLSRFLIVAWQSKAKTAAANKGELVATLTGPLQIDPTGKRCKPAQLVLVMDLNAKAAFQNNSNRFLEASHRKATKPVYKPPKQPNGRVQTPWGGYADDEPLTWCLNIRGHNKASYPCTQAIGTEMAPDFGLLFDEVGLDIETNDIISFAAHHSDLSLHPLSYF
jgi:hypothetical protein